MADTYKIVRKFKDTGRQYTLYTGVTLEQAQAHCSNPESSSYHCEKPHNRRRTKVHGIWMDVYYKE